MAHVTEYGFYQRKDGKRGHPIIVAVLVYTALRTCEMCGFMSTPKKVHYRNDCYVMDWVERWKIGTPLLCTGCWNKYRRIVYAHDTLKWAEKTMRKLKRECQLAALGKAKFDGTAKTLALVQNA